jgi:hypothetical protein
MNVNLIEESRLAELTDQVRKLIRSEDLENWMDPENDHYGSAFRHYLLFDRWPFLLNKMVTLSKEEIYCNRYYWFLKLIKAYQRKYGPDAGMEQQAFKFLEYPECDIDLLLQISDRVERENGGPKSWESS